MSDAPLFELSWRPASGSGSGSGSPDSDEPAPPTRTAPAHASHPPLDLVPRGYQVELFERACAENVIAFLETGAGKTLISALLIKKTFEDLEAVARQKKNILPPINHHDDDDDDPDDDGPRSPDPAPSLALSEDTILTTTTTTIDSPLQSSHLSPPHSQISSPLQLSPTPISPTPHPDLQHQSSPSLLRSPCELSLEGHPNVPLVRPGPPQSKAHNQPSTDQPSTDQKTSPLALQTPSSNPPEHHCTHKKENCPPGRNHPSPYGNICIFKKSAKPPSEENKVAIFLVHRVPLIIQQAKVIRSVMPSHIEVGTYYGEKGVDDWSSSKWARSLETKRVLVMTAQICLNLLRHGLIDMRSVALLVLDEVHHATKNHPYRRVFLEFYHTISDGEPRPRVFGMTATPVKVKAASLSSAPCLKAILELEATLNATVVKVSSEAMSEVEDLVPKPQEFVALYDSIGVEVDLDEDKLDEFETPSVAKVIDHLSRNEATAGEPSIVKEDSALKCEEELTRAETQLLNFLLSKLGFQAASPFAKQLCALKGVDYEETVEGLLRRSPEKDIEAGGISNKVSVLLDILFSECMRCRQDAVSAGSENLANAFRCIVFVTERATAVSLAGLINAAFKDLKCSELCARSAVGVQSSASHVRMSQAKLLDVLEDFRKGLFGILVATNVVEEGLDVPACRLVIACDKVVSPSAYVQGRGRARKRDARYVAFLEKGSEKDYGDMFMARQGAKIMSVLTPCGKSEEHERQLYRDSLVKASLCTEKKLYSKTTRAQVTGTEAVLLLYRYSLMKASRNENIPLPQYKTTKLKCGAYTCLVTLHAGVPIDGGFSTNPQETELLAKQHAALDAYSKLYQIGEVDEFLLPKRSARPKNVLRAVHRSHEVSSHVELRRGRRKSGREVLSKSSKKDKKLRQCRIIHPDALKSSRSTGGDGSLSEGAKTQGFSSKLKSMGKIAGAEHQSSMPCRNSNSKKGHLQNDGWKAEIPRLESEKSPEMYMYTLQLDQDLGELEFLPNCDDVKFGILMKNKVPSEDLKAIRCPYGEDLLSLTFEKSIPWSSSLQQMAYKYVRSVQLCLRGRAPGSSGAIDLEAKEYSKDTNTGFLLLPLVRSRNSGYEIDWPSIKTLLCFGWRCGPLERKDYEADLVRKFEHKLVCSYHEGLDRVYLSGKLNKQIQACSSPAGLLNPMFSSFSNYFEKKHKTRLMDEKQDMLEGYIVLEKMSRLSTSTFMLPPETCRVIPIPPLACYVTSLLPRWQTFLALRSCWRRNRISANPEEFLSFARALQPNVNNLAKDCADLSYERLEFLGDAVLKVLFSMAAFVMNPYDNEGFLSDERDVEVSNRKLADLAIEMKIPDCVAFSGVSQKAKAWPWFWGTHQNRSMRLSEKVLADCVESLIGAHYLQGGIEAAAIFMDKHKVLPDACKVLGISPEIGKSQGVHVKVPDLGPEDERKQSAFVREVEEKIGYRFLDKGHLVVALTHGSFRNGRCPSYQRYEYLGDAIIGFLLLSHFFGKYTHLSPGDLTSLRGPALSNDLFARVIVSLKIHERFWFECSPLEAEIKKVANLVANEEDDEEDVCKSMTVPKVLGDLLESILGAIVVDKGMRLDGIQDIVLKLMEAELDRFCNPEKFKHHPISQLVHFVQKVHNVLPEYKYLDKMEDIVKVCAIVVSGREVCRASGPTRRVAKRKAAVQTLEILRSEQEGHVDNMLSLGSL